MLLNTCLSSMTNMLLSPPTKRLTILFLCVNHITLDCLIKEIGIGNWLGNPTYTRRHLRKRKSWTIIGLVHEISTKDVELDLLSLYWIPKLHKCPFKQRYISGSAKCSTKPLSKLLTCILSAVKTGFQSYCDTS